MTDNPFLAPGAKVRARDGREAKVLDLHKGWLRTAVLSEGRWTFFDYHADGRVCVDTDLPADLVIVQPVHPDLAGTRTWVLSLTPDEENLSPDSALPYALLTLTDGISPHECVKVVLPGDGI